MLEFCSLGTGAVIVHRWPLLLFLSTVLALSACNDTGVVLDTDKTGENTTDNGLAGNGQDSPPAIDGETADVVPLNPAVAERVYTNNDADAERTWLTLDAQGRLLGLISPGSASGGSGGSGLVATYVGQSLTFRADVDSSTTADQDRALYRQVHAIQAGRGDATALSSEERLAFIGRPLLSTPDNPVTFRVNAGNSISLSDDQGNTDRQFMAVGDAASNSQAVAFDLSQLQGDWQSRSPSCDSESMQCNTWQMNLTLQLDNDGVLGIVGQSELLSDNADVLFSVPVGGQLQQHGRFAARIAFSWNTYQYEGYAFIDEDFPAELRVMATTDSELADQRIIVVSLVRQQAAP